MAIKTVVCPECKAEQAIFRQQDGTMKCAFCGAQITDLPPFDESELLPEADPETGEKAPKKLETVGDPVQAEYILSEEEVGQALTAAGRLRERRGFVIFETVFISLFAAGMLVSIILGYLGKAGMTTPTVSQWILFAILLLLIPFVWIMPERTRRRIVRDATSGRSITVLVYENLAEVLVDGEEKSWQLPFDGSYTLIESGEMLIASLKGGQLLAVPMRAIPEEKRETVCGLFRNGAGQPELKKKK